MAFILNHNVTLRLHVSFKMINFPHPYYWRSREKLHIHLVKFKLNVSPCSIHFLHLQSDTSPNWRTYEHKQKTEYLFALSFSSSSIKSSTQLLVLGNREVQGKCSFFNNLTVSTDMADIIQQHGVSKSWHDTLRTPLQ